MDKLKINEVTVDQAEGPIRRVVNARCVGPEAETVADALLCEIARNAPEDGSYYKTDVVVVLENGLEFRSRHDVKRNDPDLTVRHHLKRWLVEAADLAAARSRPQTVAELIEIEGAREIAARL